MGRRRLPDPERLLQNGGAVRIEDLFRLIHRVNPTDRGLSGAEQQRRYRLKSGLQSLLVERFGDQLRAREDGEDLVILEHVSGQRDACHAPLSSLSPAARSWVRWQLDVDDPADAVPPTAREERSATALEDARKALDEYDFPLAERLLRGALSASGGGTAEALALLELLVEQLAMDEAALDVEPALSAAAARHPQVRARLAMAAARLGRLDQAVTRIDGLPGQAEVHAELARQALAQERTELATLSLGRLRDADPAHPDVSRLEAELERRRKAGRAARRKPAEARLELLLQAQDWAGLLEEAGRVLRRFPSSNKASSLKARAQRALVDQETASLVAGAREDESRGDLVEAQEKLERALRLGADTRAEVARLKERVAHARSEERVAQVRALLPSRDGLLAWAALSESERRRFDHPRLADLDALLEVARRPREAVDALVALESLKEGQSAQRQLAILDPHASVLERSRWRALLNSLRSREGDRLLQERLRARAEKAALQEAAEVERFEQAAQRGAWIRARRIARAHEGPAWAARVDRASVHLKRAWGLQVRPGSALPYPDLRDFRLTSMLRGVNPFMISADELLLGNRAGPLIVLRRVGVDGQTRELVELRPPGDLAETVCPEVHGDLVFLHSGSRLIVLRRVPQWDVVDDIDLGALIGRPPDDAVVVEGRHAWVTADDRAWVVDLVDRRVEWSGEPAGENFELVGWKGGVGVARVLDGQLVVCRHRKPDSVQGRWALGGARTPMMGPDGQVLVLGCEDDLPDGPMCLFVLAPLLRGTRTLRETSRRLPLRMACDRPRRLVFTVGADARARWELRAFHMGGVEPVPLWRVPAPRASELVVRREGDAVALVVLSAHGCRVFALSEEPPDIPDHMFTLTAGPVHMGPPFTLVSEADFRLRRRELARLHPEKLEEGADLDGVDRIGLITALLARGDDDRASGLLARELVLNPTSEPLRLLRAAELANGRDWTGSLALLRVLTGAGLSSGQRYWKHMLECMCLGRLGDLDGSHAAAVLALAVEPANEGAIAVELTLAALRGVGDRAAFASVNRSVAVLVHGLADGRVALAEGRFTDVLRHTDNPYTWACWEAGGFYLMCRAWQALAPTDALEVARARAAAGGLIEALGHKDHLPLGDLTVDTAVMRDLALELLDGLVPGESPDRALDLEDIVLAWEEGRTARQTAEDFNCSVVSVYDARRRFGLTVRPSTREARIAWLVRCGWVREDAEWQVDQEPLNES